MVPTMGNLFVFLGVLRVETVHKVDIVHIFLCIFAHVPNYTDTRCSLATRVACLKHAVSRLVLEI